MLLASKNKLNLRTIAKSWSKEPDTVSKKKILNRLIAAYWRDEFEPDHYDPSYDGGSHREALLRAMFICGGVPTAHVKGRPDEQSPEFSDFWCFNLARLPLAKYNEVGRVMLLKTSISKAIFGKWCDDQSTARPEFWFWSRWAKSRSRVFTSTNEKMV